MRLTHLSHHPQLIQEFWVSLTRYDQILISTSKREYSPAWTFSFTLTLLSLFTCIIVFLANSSFRSSCYARIAPGPIEGNGNELQLWASYQKRQPLHTMKSRNLFKIKITQPLKKITQPLTEKSCNLKKNHANSPQKSHAASWVSEWENNATSSLKNITQPLLTKKHSTSPHYKSRNLTTQKITQPLHKKSIDLQIKIRQPLHKNIARIAKRCPENMIS